MKSQLPTKKVFLVWFLIVISYLFKFGTALIASYHYLAKDVIRESNVKGGVFYYTIVSIILLTLFVSVTKLINRMKANTFKSLFRGFTHISMVYFVMLISEYINANVKALTSVLQFTILGMLLGIVIEAVVVGKFKDYIREVGIY